MPSFSAQRYPSWDEIHRKRLERRRRRALAALREAETLARQRGGRILVYGSLVENRFGDRSDLDVAILDLPPGLDLELAVEIDTALRLAGFAADASPLRLLPPSLQDRILRHGREPSALG